MAQIITQQGRQKLAECLANGEHLLVDQFILALIPNQDPETAIDSQRTFPEIGNIVHQQAVTRSGYTSPDQVVYSLYLDDSVGDFIFNTIYTFSSSLNTVIQIITVPETQKIATKVDGNIRGQAMVRNAILVFKDAAAATNITISAAAWQFTYEEASETTKGINYIATQAEVNAGENTKKTIVPATLKTWWETIVQKFKSAAYKDAGFASGQVALLGDPSADKADELEQTLSAIDINLTPISTPAHGCSVIIEKGENAEGSWEIYNDGKIVMYFSVDFSADLPTVIVIKKYPIKLTAKIISAQITVKSNLNLTGHCSTTISPVMTAATCVRDMYGHQNAAKTNMRGFITIVGY